MQKSTFKPFTIFAVLTAVTMLSLTVAGCGESEETPLQSVAFEATMAGETSITTDKGYAVDVTSISLAIENFAFTAGGDAHIRKLAEATQKRGNIDVAYHPGHIQGGQVLGEFPGEHLIQLTADSTFQAGQTFNLSSVKYDAVNFGFFRTDDLNKGDAGATEKVSALVSGTVDIEGTSTPFEFEVVMDDDDYVLGVPFDVTIPTSGAVSVSFEFRPVDPFEDDTFFDGIDFSALPNTDGTLRISQGTPAYNRVKNTLRSHDHYVFSHRVE